MATTIFLVIFYIINILIQLGIIIFTSIPPSEYSYFFLVLDTYFLFLAIIIGSNELIILRNKTKNFTSRITRKTNIILKNQDFLLTELYYLITLIIFPLLYPDLISSIIISLLTILIINISKIFIMVDILDYLDNVNEKILNFAVEEIELTFQAPINYQFLFNNKNLFLVIIITFTIILYLFKFNSFILS